MLYFEDDPFYDAVYKSQLDSVYCPVRLVVPQDRLDHYIGLFEPTWLTTDIETAISEIREYMDMFVH